MSKPHNTASALHGDSQAARHGGNGPPAGAAAPQGPPASAFTPGSTLALWGGCECTVNRVGQQFFDQSLVNGNEERDDDIARIAALGVRALRLPILWEKVAPDGLARADWRCSDALLTSLRQRRIEPIAGLVHHGSGPRDTSLVDPQFAARLAAYAGAVADRYPWIDAWTPVNEPLTTARFSGLYGVWFPHAKDDLSFLRALFNQCRATVLAMQAIRQRNPAARLVQTDDLGKTFSTAQLHDVAAFYNERRWLGWDLLCGMVDQHHALWPYLLRSGVTAAEVLWFRDHPCPPDIIGVNHYVTSERWLDHRPERFPALRLDTVFGKPCVDVEAARAVETPTAGIGALLDETWQRYSLPMAITEVHLDAGREDQLRWLREAWQAAEGARQRGVDLRAVTAWSLLGAHNWNSLVTRAAGYYESGAFDTRFNPPRATALAGALRELAAAQPISHPVATGRGWWRRPGRLTLHGDRLLPAYCGDSDDRVDDARPILISGASGTLGRAFSRICRQRNIAHRLIGRDAMDIADASSVERALERYRPWAVINASGYVRVDQAEHDVERCFRENAIGPAILAAACARHQLHLTTFSSDLVFDGNKQRPYIETDAVAPLNVYGRSKAEGEQLVLDSLPGALVVRTSSFFGPWDEHNFLAKALAALRAGVPFSAPRDIIVSPTYVPDLVDVCLDLIIDGEAGIWHLTNGQAVCWMELAHRAALAARIDPSRLAACGASDCNYIAARPVYSALNSARAMLLPALDDALNRFLVHRSAAAGGRSTHPVHQ